MFFFFNFLPFRDNIAWCHEHSCVCSLKRLEHSRCSSGHFSCASSTSEVGAGSAGAGPFCCMLQTSQSAFSVVGVEEIEMCAGSSWGQKTYNKHFSCCMCCILVTDRHKCTSQHGTPSDRPAPAWLHEWVNDMETLTVCTCSFPLHIVAQSGAMLWCRSFILGPYFETYIIRPAPPHPPKPLSSGVVIHTVWHACHIVKWNNQSQACCSPSTYTSWCILLLSETGFTTQLHDSSTTRLVAS